MLKSKASFGFTNEKHKENSAALLQSMNGYFYKKSFAAKQHCSCVSHGETVLPASSPLGFAA
jgi:hypothetical protein